MTYNTEAGTVIGNIEPKYDAQNPIAKKMMEGFLNTFDDLVEHTNIKDVHEIGCGEGHLSYRLAERGLTVRSCDFSEQIIKQASSEYKDTGIQFSAQSIYDLDAKRDSAPLVVCCEVLEHLEEPERGLEKLAEIASDWCIVSVPREPIWRVLNMARFKYWSDLGNTPGHLQNWSKGGFIKLVNRHFDIVEVRSPLPWTMLLCRART